MTTTTGQRIRAEAGLKPHRTETLKFSTDPQLEAKIRDVVGLYLDPPERRAFIGRVERACPEGDLHVLDPLVPQDAGRNIKRPA